MSAIKTNKTIIEIIIIVCTFLFYQILEEKHILTKSKIFARVFSTMGTLYFLVIFAYTLIASILFWIIFSVFEKKLLSLVVAIFWLPALALIVLGWVTLGILAIIVSPFMGEYDEDALIAH